MAAGAAPAEAPAFSLTIGLWLLVALLVAMGLKAGWDHTLGAILRGLGNAADVGVWKVKIKAGAGFRKLDDVVQAALGDYILLNEKALGLWWHTLKAIVGYVGDTLGDFALDHMDTIYNLVHGFIPVTIRTHTAPLTESVHKGNTAARARDRAEARARARGIDATQRDIAAERLARERGIDYVGGKARVYTDAKVGRVERSIAAERRYSHSILNRRLTWLEKALGVGAIGGIAIASLTRVFPYWQCSNVRRFLRGVCRADAGMLDNLLGALFLLALPLSIEEFAETLQGIIEPVAEAVADVIAEA